MNMSKPKQRKSATLPLAVSIDATRAPKKGDPVRTSSPSGDPRNKATSLKEAFSVLKPSVVGPLYLSNFVTVEPLTSGQWAGLEQKLGT